MRLGPTRRAWIGLGIAALVSAAAPPVASADEPEITAAPSLAGSALVGGQLDAVGAAWHGRPPATESWGWLRCETDSLWDCELIDGAIASSYTVTAEDLGKYLRALLVVSNRDGRDYAWSEASAVVAEPPPPVPTPVPQPAPVEVVETVPLTPASVAPPKRMRPAPLVRVRGWLTKRGARITLLTVRAPRSARISVRCSGPGCPRRGPAKAAALTRLPAYERHLLAGARLVIRVTRTGFVGKHTLIRVRRGKTPLRRDRCLYPGSERPRACSAD
jgi:hypothetical protein